jgi:hypothetical protein
MMIKRVLDIEEFATASRLEEISKGIQVLFHEMRTPEKLSRFVRAAKMFYEMKIYTYERYEML